MRGIFRLQADLRINNRITAPPIVSAQQSKKGFSKPLYDTGEHVLAGESPAIAKLISGYKLEVNDIEFSYGELIAAADLFQDLEKMENTPKINLLKIKTLIVQSRDYYANRLKSVPLPTMFAPDVSNADWNSVTDGRYLELAEDNFEHFAFDSNYPDRNNKKAWESYHQQALTKAQEGEIEKALKLNAFGDHFLTDAFSAGHFVNKEKVFNLVNTAIYANPILYSHKFTRPVVGEQSRDFKNLSQAGVDMVLAVSREAYKDKGLASFFKGYEIIVDDFFTPNPDIDRESMFSLLMIGIADDLTLGKPQISNLVAKGIHDYLGKTGVEVQFNGSTPTMLYGDGRLSNAILPFVNSAVERSIDEILGTPGPLLPAWDFTSVPTANGRATIARISNISASNTDLIQTMAEVVKREYKLIAKKLDDKNIIGETAF